MHQRSSHGAPVGAIEAALRGNELGAVDFGRTASDYATHRAGFPESLFRRLADAYQVGCTGQRILDLGTGTGTLARGFAQAGAEVTGLDRAPELLEQAAALDKAVGVSIRYHQGVAEKTGFPAEAFDVVTAGQCWHWFDRSVAAEEVYRLLVPGGRLAICHFDWIPAPGSAVEATEALIRRHNPDWKMHGGTGIYPAWLADLSGAGFSELETFSYDEDVRYSHMGWRGRIRASAGVSATLSPEQVAAFDGALAELLAERFPADPVQTPHRVFAAIGRKPT